MSIHLESPAPYESNQQCFKCELDSEAWSTNAGKERTSRRLSLYPADISCDFSPHDVPHKVT